MSEILILPHSTKDMFLSNSCFLISSCIMWRKFSYKDLRQQYKTGKASVLHGQWGYCWEPKLKNGSAQIFTEILHNNSSIKTNPIEDLTLTCSIQNKIKRFVELGFKKSQIFQKNRVVRKYTLELLPFDTNCLFILFFYLFHFIYFLCLGIFVL